MDDQEHQQMKIPVEIVQYQFMKTDVSIKLQTSAHKTKRTIKQTQ